MKPIQTIKFDGVSRFYGTPYIYLAITEMHDLFMNPKVYPVVYSINILWFAFGFVRIKKEKQ